jgi:hypothetical protein
MGRFASGISSEAEPSSTINEKTMTFTRVIEDGKPWSASHAVGGSITTRSRGRCSGNVLRSGRVRVNTSQPSFGGVVREAHAPILKEQGEARPSLQNVVERFGQVMPAREFDEDKRPDGNIFFAGSDALGGE